MRWCKIPSELNSFLSEVSCGSENGGKPQDNIKGKPSVI